MAKETTTEETPETGKETPEVKATEKETSTPKESLTPAPGDTEVEIKSADDEEKDANTETVEEDGGLFEDEEKHSEEDLTGIDSEKEEKKASEAEEKKKEEDAAAAKPKDEEKKVEEEKEPEKKAEPEKKEEVKLEEKEPEKKEEKPPKGFVSKQALKEARADIKALRDEVAALKTSPAPQETKADKKWGNFKPLTDGEYNDLVDEDPQEAMKYDRKLRQYEAYKSEKDTKEKEGRESQKEYDNTVAEWTEEINKAVPGVYEEDSDVASELAEFAKEYGFDSEEYLAVMTDPRTLVIPQGQSKTFHLGPGVKGLLKVLSNAKEKISSGVNEKELREKIEKEITEKLTPEITNKITKQLTEKLKGPEGEAFRSLTEVPGGGDDVELGTEPQTEEGWAKLKRQNPEKARELLGG